MMSLLVVHSGRFADHAPPPGHPERADRNAVMQAAAEKWRALGATLAEPRPATREEILRVHSTRFVETLEAAAGRAVMLDPDTFTSPATWDVTRLAAGAALVAVDHVLDGRAGRAMALARPPGHHSGRGLARGFCLVNSVAVAAAHALQRGVGRVAIIDFDVHHGNGTQEIFDTHPRVLFVSTHQWPFYPGTGAVDDAGNGEGRGFTVNVPIERGATDADYDAIFRHLGMPVVRAFDPDLILVSAGYDAHERDPLGGMRVTTDGFGSLVRHLVATADACCGGRLVLVTEGGYDLPALGESVDATLAVLHAGGDAPPEPEAGSGVTACGLAALGRARAVQSRYWRGL